ATQTDFGGRVEIEAEFETEPASLILQEEPGQERFDVTLHSAELVVQLIDPGTCRTQRGNVVVVGGSLENVEQGSLEPRQLGVGEGQHRARAIGTKLARPLEHASNRSDRPE